VKTRTVSSTVLLLRACAWFTLVGLAACAKEESDQFVWRLTLDSTGGLNGQGLGRVVVTSDGKIEASRLGRSCEAKLGGDDLRAIQQAVGAVAPGNWGADYQPSKTQVCCDRVSWQLEVTLQMSDGAKRTAHADWHESAMGQLPPDLRALAMVAERVLDRSMEKCSGG
jgi:hypothetical protein